MAAVGLDLGTTSIKLCVVDSQGNILSSDKRQHEQEKTESSGIQDGQKIIELALQMLTDPCRRWLKITDIYISGQMHGVVLWNDEDIRKGDLSSLSPFHTWTYRNEAGTIENITSWKSEGTKIYEGYGSATLIELMKNNYNQRYNRCGTIMDLLACVLTKSKEVHMSEQLAESWGLTIRTDDILEWDHVFQQKMEKLMNLPNIVKSPACLGKSVIEGLDTINVHVPAGDLQASVSSIAGPDFPSDTAFIVLGTSAQLCTIQPKTSSGLIDLKSFPALQLLSFNENYNLLAACSMNGGNALVSSIRTLGQWSTRTRVNVSQMLADVDEVVTDKTNDTNVKVTCVRFIPERDQDSQGETGLSIKGIQNDTKLTDVLAAVSAGVVENLFSLFPREVFEILQIKQIFLIGEANLCRYSTPIEEIAADIGVSCRKTFTTINASLGAILLSMEHH